MQRAAFDGLHRNRIGAGRQCQHAQVVHLRDKGGCAFFSKEEMFSLVSKEEMVSLGGSDSTSEARSSTCEVGERDRYLYQRGMKETFVNTQRGMRETFINTNKEKERPLLIPTRERDSYECERSRVCRRSLVTAAPRHENHP